MKSRYSFIYRQFSAANFSVGHEKKAQNKYDLYKINVGAAWMSHTTVHSLFQSYKARPATPVPPLRSALRTHGAGSRPWDYFSCQDVNLLSLAARSCWETAMSVEFSESCNAV